MTTDVLDILELEEHAQRKISINSKSLLSLTEKKKTIPKNLPRKRPGHIPREVWGLQNTFKNELPPIIPTDTEPVYKQPKAIIGIGRVRKWKWVPFKCPARSDNLVLSHWRREENADSTDDYFTRFNKHVEVPTYSRSEYTAHLEDSKWTSRQTEHLMELARLYDVRFIHMRDRWDADTHGQRPSLEEMKARYYGILSTLDRIRGTNLSQGLRYDVSHECRRKQQLSLLYGRSREDVEDEERLISELNRIEARRRDRERKKQDLQKLISQADSLGHEFIGESAMRTGQESVRPRGECLSTGDHHMVTSRPSLEPGISTAPQSQSSVQASQPPRKRPALGVEAGLVSRTSASLPSGQAHISAGLLSAANTAANSLTATGCIPFMEIGKSPGVQLRSHRMKLPSSLGQKKIRVIENFLSHFQMDPNPPATSQIVEAYNSIRSNILLLYDLRTAALQCDFELQAARSRMELFAPDRALPSGLLNLTKSSTEINRSAVNRDRASTSSSPAPACIDLSIVAALRVADSKRPVLPRHSYGLAGSLSAASGSGLTSNQPIRCLPEVLHSLRASPASELKDLSPPLSVTSDSDSMHISPSSRNRRKRSVTEQGQTLKRLKLKDQPVD